MDIYNTKEIGKNSPINDEYWYEAWPLAKQLLVAVRNDNDYKIINLLRNPKLFRGRS